jgi:hypothetical protein
MPPKKIIPQILAKKLIFRLEMMCLLATYNINEKNFFGIFKDPALEPDPDPHQNVTDPQQWLLW